MASCSYSSILKEKSSFPCGSNWKNPDDFSCVTLRDCNLDVASHLTSCKVADNRIENEMRLLVARAGTVLLFIIVFSDFSINVWTLTVPCLPCCFTLFTLCRGIYYWRVPHIVDSVSTTSGKIWGWLEGWKGPMFHSKCDCGTQVLVSQRGSWNQQQRVGFRIDWWGNVSSHRNT